MHKCKCWPEKQLCTLQPLHRVSPDIPTVGRHDIYEPCKLFSTGLFLARQSLCSPNYQRHQRTSSIDLITDQLQRDHPPWTGQGKKELPLSIGKTSKPNPFAAGWQGMTGTLRSDRMIRNDPEEWHLRDRESKGNCCNLQVRA